MSEAREGPLSALDAIYMRRSVRTYTGQPLDNVTVRALLDAAVQAPTAMHEEPCAFVVVQSAAALKRCSDRAKAMWAKDAERHRDLHLVAGTTSRSAFEERLASPDFSIFYDAGTLIVICGKPLGPFVTADCWLAAENLMLAAFAMGLGTCCIGLALPMLNAPDIKAELGIPAEVTAVAAIVVGVPRGEAVSVARKDPEILAWV